MSKRFLFGWVLLIDGDYSKELMSKHAEVIVSHGLSELANSTKTQNVIYMKEWKQIVLNLKKYTKRI